MKTGIIGLVGLAIWLLFSLITGRKSQNPQTASTIDRIDLLKLIWKIALTRGLLLSQAKLLIYQSAHETGNWKSYAYLEDNNLFGMKMPVKRVTLATRSGNSGYAHYNSVNDSINDMIDWLSYNKFEMPANDSKADIEQYAVSLKDDSYYTDTVANYASAMIAWKAKLDPVSFPLINVLL